ncbi:methyltransferase domain-containing protein [Mesorhizobium sp.]|uniref:class I SAM-dependent methyltransferase n=1 Tax=Mesorhizobium sp. TaxID=1871066 RepID=UPI000FE2C634|nr:methyltransferase domain-containing protein [Mesorhizobium sp.]RWN55630.1 MAG: class I SAM-dependent methyltransferase [Mesorhizobium sp.]RWN77219.1 MAG: class I SAM-dependent methyltransferase [Mesorhizobium sp.]RWN80242.1 MAG: class I SAM-dependent methyltransferase [Mesorhizobium sp.]RWN86155.1 MAG: class I SAM-dependent methyltransferase [Mesorhizobium sp.]RWO14955.1 MAG: class I SAM-dependent methyltransferase [Mesorhizobium sp.]
MSRVEKTGTLIRGLDEVSTLLDVGCRDGILRDHIPDHIDYSGADLFPIGDHVKYVGDFLTIGFDRKFDVVTAIDVLEHLDQPQQAFDKLVTLANRHLIVSLPNCYDLKSRYKFAVKGRLGGKYDFRDEEILDRHRWVMSAEEISNFYLSKARRHGLSLRVHGVRYGSGSRVSATAVLGRLACTILPSSLGWHSVVGEFTVPL